MPTNVHTCLVGNCSVSVDYKVLIFFDAVSRSVKYLDDKEPRKTWFLCSDSIKKNSSATMGLFLINSSHSGERNSDTSSND